MVIFIGIMLSVFQQAVGINAVLYFAPRIFETMGMANPMVQTVLMGVVNILFTLLAVFTVEKWGRKPLLISGSVGMAIGAFGVAMCNIVTGLPAIISVISIMVYSASFMFSWGPICWVLIARNLPEHHPWRCGSHCGGIPMDFQLYCFVYFPADVQYASRGDGR